VDGYAREHPLVHAFALDGADARQAVGQPPLLPTKLRSRPIDVGRSSGRSSRNVPSALRRTRGLGR